jgi:hypothetical protein
VRYSSIDHTKERGISMKANVGLGAMSMLLVGIVHKGFHVSEVACLFLDYAANWTPVYQKLRGRYRNPSIFSRNTAGTPD